MRIWTVPLKNGSEINVKSQKKDEAKHLARCINKLLQISAYRKELSGVFGKDERESVYFVIGQSYPVKESARKEIMGFIGSLPAVITDTKKLYEHTEYLFYKHVNIDDKRQTPAEAKEETKKYKRISEELDTKRFNEEMEFVSIWCRPEKVEVPDGMMPVIMRVTYDSSDITSDYFAPHSQHGHDILLDFVRKGPKTQQFARRALAKYPELQKLGWRWHTENYSMGHGNYLLSEWTGNMINVKSLGNRDKVDTRLEVRFGTYKKEIYPYKNYMLQQMPVKSEDYLKVTDNNEAKKACDVPAMTASVATESFAQISMF